MSNYDFSTLNSSDFEELICDLLNAEEQRIKSNIVFRTFKDGRDKGIDFRHSSITNDNEIIGQAKHYYRTGYNQLKRVLRTEEIAKVNQLNPAKYILVTSLDLSVANTEELKQIMEPYIKNLDDIYGKKDINRLIDKHPDVLRNHFKLWFSSTEVLKSLLNYEIEGRSNEFQEQVLKKKIRLYVPTKALEIASTILDDSHFVIIIGGPGVGKTTTAELLLYKMIKDGYELVYINDDVREIESKITPDEKKQIFYFDDFLGHNSLEIAKARSSETTLIKILRRISVAKNKRFILTTRTFILNAAFEDSERLRQFNVKTRASVVELSNYTPEIRAKLLSNHINECELKKELIEVLVDPIVQKFVVNHTNFSPRSVEFITFNETIKQFSHNQFKRFIEENFNTPDEIWRHAYEQQITDIDRILINTMFSFGDVANIDMLERAFNRRVEYEVNNNNFRKPMNAFKTSFRRIEGGFFDSMSNAPGWFKFINASLVDFLLNYIMSDTDEIARISESAFYLNQLSTRFFFVDETSYNSSCRELSFRLKNTLLFNYKIFIQQNSQNHDRLHLICLLNLYIEVEEAEPIILELLDNIKEWKFLSEDHDIGYFFQFFLEHVKSTVIVRKIAERASDLVPDYVWMLNDFTNIYEFMKSFQTKFKIDNATLLKSSDISSLSERITSLLNEEIEMHLIGISDDGIDVKNSIAKYEIEVNDIVEYFASFGLKLNVDYTLFYNTDNLEVNEFQKQEYPNIIDDSYYDNQKTDINEVDDLPF